MSLQNTSVTDQEGCTNVLSNSLLNDNVFWKDFLNSDSDNVIRSTASITACVLNTRRTPNDNEIQDKLDEDKLLHDDFSDSMFLQIPDLTIESRTPKHELSTKLLASTTKRKTKQINNCESKPKKYKHDNSRLQHKICFSSNSYLYRIKSHIEKYVENKIPVFLIKDLLRATRYCIFNELYCKHLCQINGIVFAKVVCRGTIVGLAKQSGALTFLIDDGTANLWCTMDQNCFDECNELIDNFPITENFDAPPYNVIRSEADIKWGIIVQALGILQMHHKTLSVKKLYRESQIMIRREVSYLTYVRSLSGVYDKWKQDIVNIYS